jgi:hypothetical protein
VTQLSQATRVLTGPDAAQACGKRIGPGSGYRCGRPLWRTPRRRRDGLRRGSLDGAGSRHRIRYVVAALAQALDVDDDSLADQAIDFVARFADYTEAGRSGQ